MLTIRTSRARKALSLSTVAVSAGALALGLASTAAAQTERFHGPIKGIVPSRLSHSAKPGGGGSSNLIFHGGPVLDGGNTVYTVFWQPRNWSGGGFSSDYQTLINQYFSDVAAATAANLMSNVYYAATQYGSTGAVPGSTQTNLGSLTTATAFGPSNTVTVQDAYTNDCRDRDTTACVSDAQIVTELNKAIGEAGWTTGPNKIFFMFTPKGLGSCYSNSSCSFTQFCAYHSNAGGMLYANMPYADTVPRACDAGYHPNNSDADATINVVSHEHNETITDPFGSAWYNSTGYENGDLCAWNFGTMLGATAYGSYNQVINNHYYALQQEWSNRSSGCVLQGT